MSAAYTMLALDAFARTSSTTTKVGITEIGKDGRSRALALPAGAMPKAAIPETAARLEFSKAGPLSAYYVVNESGFDRNQPTAEMNNGIEIFREFVDAKGVPVTRVTVGQEFFVRLRLRATQRDRVPQIAIVDLMPGGVEAVLELQPPADTSVAGVDPALARRRTSASALPIGVPGQSNWFPSHVDLRADRLVLYGQATRDVGTFVYRARATNAGVFQIPPAFAEGMYNRTITGLKPGRKAGDRQAVKRGCESPSAIALVLLRCWPHASLAQQVPLSTGVWSSDGELLRVTRAPDDQYRLWVPLSDISPTLVEAFLLKEDRWFYWHTGVNPIALVRAGFRTYRSGVRQGGSTVTMQLARMMYRLNTGHRRKTASGRRRRSGSRRDIRSASCWKRI